MWWLDPRDEATFTIHDQFALGDDLIVAPVVERRATTRDIYLTQGRWRDPFAEVTPCRCSMRCMRTCRSADRSAPFFLPLQTASAWQRQQLSDLVCSMARCCLS